MVKVIVLVEGGQPAPAGGSAELGMIGVGATFREGFRKLLGQAFPASHFQIEIRNIGSITNAKTTLAQMHASEQPYVLLIDLDAPPSERAKRLAISYPDPAHHPNIFFMVQEMEAWFFAQPQHLDAHFQEDGAKLKDESVTISFKNALKGKHPETLKKPGDHLVTVVKQVYERPKRDGKLKPVQYAKGKDAPEVLKRLHLPDLITTFSEVKALVERLQSFA
jgi:hypothetical protein